MLVGITIKKKKNNMKNKSNISIICAIDKNRGIGKNNKLLIHLPKDLKRFKRITLGHPVIMGLNTFYSIGKPLPNRLNIVLTKNSKEKISDVEIANSISQALDIAKKSNSDEVFIIGGGSIYKQFIDIANRLYLTIIDKVFEADTFFPDYSQFKKTVSRETDIDEGLKLIYLTLER